MELKGKKVMVLGLARTGSETARFLVRQGVEVQVSDCRDEKEFQGELEALSGLPIRFRLGGEEIALLEGVDILITSPGVPPGNSLLRGASRQGIEVLSEIELAYRFLAVPLVAITGTNGKSTTTSLIGEILKGKGLRTFIGGECRCTIDRICFRTMGLGSSGGEQFSTRVGGEIPSQDRSVAEPNRRSPRPLSGLCLLLRSQGEDLWRSGERGYRRPQSG